MTTSSPSATLYVNCEVITGDPASPRADVLAISDGAVVAVGSKGDVGAQLPSDWRRHDLGGAVIVPGLDDCHMHILSLGLKLGQVDVSSAAAPTLDALAAAVAGRAATTPAGEWILGRGYNQNLLPQRRHPERADLDPVALQNPVALWHTSGHVMSVNSLALEMAGIGPGTGDPSGGRIARDAGGEPTGVLEETAMGLVGRVIPPPTAALAEQAILKASRILAQEGITGASDAATGQHLGLEPEIGAYAGALASGKMCTRVVVMPVVQEVMRRDNEPLTPLQLEPTSDPSWLKIGPVKIFADGALTTRTAALVEPYSDGDTGLLTWPPRELSEMIRQLHGSGRQIATHAIGDRAIDAVLDAYDSAIRLAPRQDHRHRIEHCTLARRESVTRMKRLGIVPVLQPEDIAVLGDAYEPAVGTARAENNSPVGWFAAAGLPIAFSSDRPVTPGNPLVGVRAAVERRTASGRVLGADHRVEAEQALRYYSAGAAFATFSNGVRGMLRPGLRADFAVLDRDITVCPPEAITEARVLLTVVDGRLVYEA